MKIKITTIIVTGLLLSIVSVAHASDTTIINNISVGSNSGGKTVSPGESITTGSATSEVYVETQIGDNEPIIIHEIKTSGDDENTSIDVVQIIENDDIRSEVTTSTEQKKTVNTVEAEKTQNSDAVTTTEKRAAEVIDKNQKIEIELEK